MTWIFFGAAHGNGAADGIGGVLKRTADRLFELGSEISDDNNIYLGLKDVSSVRLNLIAKEFNTDLWEYCAIIRYHENSLGFHGGSWSSKGQKLQLFLSARVLLLHGSQALRYITNCSGTVNSRSELQSFTALPIIA